MVGKGKYKFKMTPQRMAILNFLKDNKSHPTVEDVYKSIIKQYPSVSLATVYKNLEMFKNLGMVKELNIEQGKKHFDPDMTDHHHIVCTKCNKIVDVEADFDLSLPEYSKKGFEIINSRVEFYGICPECKHKNKKN